MTWIGVDRFPAPVIEPSGVEVRWIRAKGAKTRERLFGSPSRRQAPGYEGPDLERAEVSLAPTVLPVDCLCHRCGLRQEVDPEAIDVAATLPMADTTLRFGVAKRCGWW